MIFGLDTFDGQGYHLLDPNLCFPIGILFGSLAVRWLMDSITLYWMAILDIFCCFGSPAIE